MNTYPDLQTIKQYAETGTYRTIPVSIEMYSDMYTPIGVLRVLKKVSDHCYMFESAEDAKQWGRYSFLGFEPTMEISCRNGKIRIKNGAVTEAQTNHPGKYIREVIEKHKAPQIEGLPTFTGGLVGYFSYDYIKYVEPTLNLDAQDDAHFRDMDLMLFDQVIAFDHLQQKIILIVNMPLTEEDGNVKSKEALKMAYEDAKQIVREAILNFKNRDKSKVLIPELKSSATVGYSLDAILGQLDRVVNSQIDSTGTLKPLADCLKSGVLRGAVGVVGCNNAKGVSNKAHITIMKELIKNDILVVTTGCGASAAAKFGLMTKEARKLAGKGLATVCELVDIPPVLHLGSCVDCSRILEIVSETAKTLDMDICDLPVAGVAPEWMSEKAVAIGTYVVASGIDTYLGIMPPVKGSSRAVEILCDELQDIVGAKFTVNENPEELAQIIISDIEKKRVHFEKLVEEKMKQVVEVEA